MEAQRVFQVDDDLVKPADNAWELAVALRDREDVEAYVWHDRYESIVTVGGFDSEQDPRIRQFARMFGATPAHAGAGGSIQQVSYLPQNSRHLGMVAGDSGVKFFAIDGAGRKADENRMWLFDPSPRLMRVPELQSRSLRHTRELCVGDEFRKASRAPGGQITVPLSLVWTCEQSVCLGAARRRVRAFGEYDQPSRLAVLLHRPVAWPAPFSAGHVPRQSRCSAGLRHSRIPWRC